MIITVFKYIQEELLYKFVRSLRYYPLRRHVSGLFCRSEIHCMSLQIRLDAERWLLGSRVRCDHIVYEYFKLFKNFCLTYPGFFVLCFLNSLFFVLN